MSLESIWTFLGFSWEPMRVVFGDCAFDPETRQLLREEKPVHLSPKAFHLLEILLEGRPKAFSKAEIHERVWPGAFVSEVTLASLVTEIREAIGEQAKDARFIRTVHGFGYAFSGAASEVGGETAGQQSRWRLIWNERVISLPEGETILGRGNSCRVRIDDANVSRRHARIVVAAEEATLEDLGSRNGVFVGDERISQPRRLGDGDTIRIGPTTLTIRRAVSADDATQTEVDPAKIQPPGPPRPRPTGRARGR